MADDLDLDVDSIISRLLEGESPEFGSVLWSS